jgi:phosphate transport system substrate-binding protein
MRDLLAGRADCVSMVREPFPSELAAFRARFGHEPLLVPIARGSFATRGGTHAIAIYVNAANPLRGLTLAQLKAAFGAERPARTWGDLGAAGAWAARPLHVYGMTPRRASGDPPGVVNFLEQQMLGGGPFRADLQVQVDRPGEQALAAIVRKVAEDPDGIGYSGFGYAQAGARALPLAGSAEGPFATGSPESVADGRYALARRIYILADRPLPPELRRFLAFVLSPRGQAMIGRDAEGFLPLTPAERSAALRLLK